MSKVNRGNNRMHQRRAYGVLMKFLQASWRWRRLRLSARPRGNRHSAGSIVTLAPSPLNDWNGDYGTSRLGVNGVQSVFFG